MNENEPSVESLKEYIKTLETEIISFLWHIEYSDKIDTKFNDWEANETPLIKEIIIRSNTK